MCGIALRLMLVLCLVLTGIGNAVAAVSMPAAMVGTHDVASVIPVGQIPSSSACDQEPDHAPKLAASGHRDLPTTPHPADCGEDCCNVGACECPCLALAQATLPEPPSVPASNGQVRVVTGFPAALAPPALPHLIRPPIG